MKEFSGKVENGKLVIVLSGRIDSNNASMIEAEAMELALKNKGIPVRQC